MKVQLERRAECRTDTQYIVNLSGYKWCAEQLKDIKNMKILDAACGTGYGTFYVAQKALEVVGIDKAMDAIKFARNKYQRENLLFMQMDCTELKFDNGSFDAIISQDTIEHIQEDKKFFSEAKRVLKNNGTFILFTPHSLIHNNKPSNIYHIREYSKDSLKELIADYFSDIKFHGRRLSPELSKLEKDLDEIRRIDKFGIRVIVPRSIRHLLGNLLAKIKGNISLEDVSCHHVDYFEGVEGSPTLIAICKNL